MENNRMMTSVLDFRARQKNIPLCGTFELTPLCNLSCKMCYVRKSVQEVATHDRKMMTLEQWKHIADEAYDSGLLFLLLTGGEPFIYPDFKELYAYLHKKGFIISINSNGTMISGETIQWLVNMPPARINITLYGSSDETYEKLCGVKGMYQKVVYNIDRLIDAGILVKLNASMTPYNINDMEDIVKFAKERDIIVQVGTYMYPPIRRDEKSIGVGDRFTPKETAFYTLKYQRLLRSDDEYNKYLLDAANGLITPPGLDENCLDPVDGQVKCQAGRASFWATWDGYLMPCGMVPRPNIDLYRYTFNEAWSMLVEEVRQIKLSGVCQNCDNKKVCHCCMASAISETGQFSGIPLYLCEMAKEIRLLAKEELKADKLTVNNK